MKKIVALFDCDGTLYSAQYGRGLMKYASENGRKRISQIYYASMLLPFVLRKVKLVAEEKYHRALLSRMAWLVKGMDEQEFRKATEWLLHHHLLPTERPEVIARLREHQSKGHEVVLVSAQFTTSLEMLAAHYNVHGFVGTPLESREGRFTGSIIPPVITGDDKERYAREYFSSRGMDVDWEASYAYADSITDTGLFSMVGHPVAVSPDAKLHALAQSKNWEIIGEAK
jgi:HAD superfamily hydrolase (TIGR01490 family)